MIKLRHSILRLIFREAEIKFKDYDWIDWGIYFGYPPCCIEEFCNMGHLDAPKRKFNGTGFVPCKSCNELDEEELITDINLNRECDAEFPKRDRLLKLHDARFNYIRRRYL